MQLDRVPTPALVIDAAVVERNIARLAAYGKEHRISIRPHTKTHKSLEMARQQVAMGATGLTVAKIGEAEVMRQATEDLLVAYPVLHPERGRVLAEMAREITIRVGLDSAYAADAIQAACQSADSTIGVLVDVDTGYHRTGVQSAEESLALAKHIDGCSHLRLDGLMFFPGNINQPPEQQIEILDGISRFLLKIIALWEKNGFETNIVSGGSTPSAFQSHRIPPITEIRPGTYIYNDMNTVRGGNCTLDDCAARVICTIVSTAVSGKVIIDAGSKTLSSDRSPIDPASDGFGYVVEYPEVKIMRLSEEHGELDITACSKPPQLGDRVQVIPNHICPCVNLQNAAWVKEGAGRLRRLPIDARGLLS